MLTLCSHHRLAGGSAPCRPSGTQADGAATPSTLPVTIEEHVSAESCKQPLDAWAASDRCHFCAQFMVRISHTFSPFVDPVVGCAASREAHLWVPPGAPELQSCLTQGHTFSMAAHTQRLLQVGILRPGHFDPTWDNSMLAPGISVDLARAVVGRLNSFCSILLSFLPFHGVAPRTLQNKHPVHYTPSQGSLPTTQPMTPSICPRG